MTKISILGCGWLGLPLAKALIKKGFIVNGSTTSTEKLQLLENAGINPFLISLTSNNVIGAVETFLVDSSILIIDIPPKLRGVNKESFVEKIEGLIPYIEKSIVEKVLFVSSTSVYGEENDLVNEQSPLNPDTESGQQLLQVEQLLHSNIDFKTTVLRFGGLIGEDRHPIKFLAGRENLDNPYAPINLIHQEDCIGIILKIIETDSFNETFNGVSPFHPSRYDYYTEKAATLNLPLPQFNHQDRSVGKTILSDKVVSVLNYTFTKPNL